MDVDEHALYQAVTQAAPDGADAVGLEVVATARGFVVFMPLWDSCGDGVVLSVYPAGGRWRVSDDAASVARLADWGVRARPEVVRCLAGSLVVEDGQGCLAVEAVTDGAGLGGVCWQVGLACLRVLALADRDDWV